MSRRNQPPSSVDGAGNAPTRKPREAPSANLGDRLAELRDIASFPEENPNPVLRGDREGRVLYANPAGEELLKTLSREADGALPALLHEAARRVLEKGNRHEVEISCPDGRVFSLALSPSRTEGWVNFYGRDITERKRTETALRASEERYRRLLAVMPAAMYTCDAEGVITYFNEQAAAIWGRSPKLGDTDERFCGSFRLYRPDGSPLPHDQTPMAAALGDGTSVRNREVVIERPDGSRVSVAVNIDPLRDATGGICGATNVFTDISERKEVERKSRENEQFVRRVLDSLFVFVGVLTPDGTLIEANRAPLVAAGITPEDVIGRKFWDCHWWSYAPKVQAQLRDAIHRANSGQSVRYDVPVRMTGDSLMWIDFQIAPLRDQAGRITHLIPSAMDLTARKEAEEAVRRSEGRWNAAIENFGEGVIIASEAEQVIYWNPAARVMHGFISGGEGIGPLSETPKTFELWTPDGGRLLALDEWPMRRIKRGERVRNFELRLRRPDQGWERVVAYSGSMVETAGGERLIFLSVHDLTEQRKAEAALRESEQFYRQTLESIPGMVFTTRADGYCDYQSQQWVDYTGVPLEEQLGDRWNELLHPADRERAFVAWRDAVEGKAAYNLEYRVRRHDGEYEWFKVIGRPIREEAGAVVRWFGVAANINELKRAEDALRASHDAFRHLVDNSPFGIYAVDADFRLVQVSAGAQKVFENVRPLLGRDFTEVMRAIWPEPFASEAIGHFRRTLETGVPYDSPSMIETRFDIGQVESYDWKIERVTLPDGRLGVVCHFYDLSERQRYETALRKRDERLQLLVETAEALITATDPQAVAENLCRRVMDHLDCDVFFNFLTESGSSRLQLNACAGIPPEEAREIQWLEPGAAVCGCVARDRRRIVAEDIQNTPDERTALVRSYGVQSYCCHPLLAGDRLIGTLSFGTRKRVQLENDEIELMRAVANQVAIAMERIRADQVVRESEEKFRTLADNISQFAWMADAEGWIFWYNRRWFDYTGTNLEQMEGWGWQAVHHPDHVQRVVERFRACVQGGRRWEDTFPLRGKDGQYRWFLSRAVPIRDQLGNVVRWFGTNTDVTEQRLAEAALRQSEERLRLAKTAGQIGIHDFNPVTGELLWDERVRELWGLGPDDPVNYDLFISGIHPEDRAATDAAVQRALDPSGDGNLFIEYRLVNRDQARWIAATGKTTFKEGQAVRLVGTVQDITQQKEFGAELERLVAERTAKLHELVGELEHFSYSITHDMRAPLRAMRGFAEVIQETMTTRAEPEVNAFLKRIITSAERMDRLITDALNYSRTVRQELTMVPVDVGRLLEGMLETYPQFLANRVYIRVDRDLPVVIGNEAGLTQCFSNLIGNALKFFAPERNPGVRVWAEPVSGSDDAPGQPPGWVRIWVEDKGIGITPEMLPRVFDMFVRGTNSHEGTGIGLALVRKVVHRMGGKVGVLSEPGKGSRFWVELKRADVLLGGG